MAAVSPKMPKTLGARLDVIGFPLSTYKTLKATVRHRLSDRSAPRGGAPLSRTLAESPEGSKGMHTRPSSLGRL